MKSGKPDAVAKRSRRRGLINHFFWSFISGFSIIAVLAYYTTQEFRLDFVIGVGSRGNRPLSSLLMTKLGLKEGSMDHLLILGFQKNVPELLHCYETVARQTVARHTYESINFQPVALSTGFYAKKSIITCGSNLDEKYKCHSHSEKSSSEFSQILSPVNSAQVNINGEIWILGGRERIIPNDGPLMEPASYSTTSFSQKIITLDTTYLSNDFVDDGKHRLPFPIAFHCAIYIGTVCSKNSRFEIRNSTYVRLIFFTDIVFTAKSQFKECPRSAHFDSLNQDFLK